jgi:hypothetical protein
MKLPKLYLRDLISERFTRRLFGWLKFLSPQPRRRDPPEADKFPHKDRRTSPLRFNTLLGYFGIFTTAHRAVVPHFRFKKNLILYLNSSRAAPRVGISTLFRQAAGNSNLNS